MHLICTCGKRYDALSEELEELRRAFRALERETLDLNEKTTRLFRRAKKRQEDLDRDEPTDPQSERDRLQQAILERRHGLLRQG